MTAERETQGPQLFPLRCPFCHDDLAAETAQKACTGCRALYHQACWDEVGRACVICPGTSTPVERVSALASALDSLGLPTDERALRSMRRALALSAALLPATIVLAVVLVFGVMGPDLIAMGPFVTHSYGGRHALVGFGLGLAPLLIPLGMGLFLRLDTAKG